MGLDMYLKLKTSTEEKEVGYWRKSNQIHAWILKNVCDGNTELNCHEVEVPIAKVQELLLHCEKILEVFVLKKDWVVYAQQHLPTMGGFFWGQVEYNDEYLFDIFNTIRILRPLVNNQTTTDSKLFYYCSW